MKKHLTIITLFVILVGIFVSCTNAEPSRTPIPTDDTITRSNVGALEVPTSANDEKTHTVTNGREQSSFSAEKSKSAPNDDNEVSFETTTAGGYTVSPKTDTTKYNNDGPPSTPTPTENTETTTEPVTDSDGWINRWY